MKSAGRRSRTGLHLPRTDKSSQPLDKVPRAPRRGSRPAEPSRTERDWACQKRAAIGASDGICGHDLLSMHTGAASLLLSATASGEMIELLSRFAGVNRLVRLTDLHLRIMSNRSLMTYTNEVDSLIHGHWEVLMNEKVKPEMISRRGVFALAGLAVASSLAVPVTVMTATDAEARVGNPASAASVAGVNRRDRRRDRRTKNKN